MADTNSSLYRIMTFDKTKRAQMQAEDSKKRVNEPSLYDTVRSKLSKSFGASEAKAEPKADINLKSEDLTNVKEYQNRMRGMKF